MFAVNTKSQKRQSHKNCYSFLNHIDFCILVCDAQCYEILPKSSVSKCIKPTGTTSWVEQYLYSFIMMLGEFFQLHTECAQLKKKSQFLTQVTEQQMPHWDAFNSSTYEK